MKPLLEACGLSKSFLKQDGAPLRVIQNVDFQLNAGEIVCLLGASGCGKTTLLQILAGLDTPTTGNIHASIERPGPALGYLRQTDRMLPWRNTLGNAALGAELLGQDKLSAQKSARGLLNQCGLSGFENSMPHEISGGMRQRALLARMLGTDPQLLLLDEPMSALDVPARRDIARVLRDYVRAKNAAALIVTHSVEEACALADRILIITRIPAIIFADIPAKDISMDAVQEKLLASLGVRT